MTTRPLPAATALLTLALSPLALAPPIAAEVVTSVTVDAYNTVGITGDDTTAAGLARGEIDFQSQGNSDVRGRLQLRGYLVAIDGVSTSVLTIPRAEIRWRMYVGESYRMRFTVGRSRLSWGDGVLYNAADTINGAQPGSVDLTADTLRDETRWIASGFFPLGRFAFFEPVVLVPGYAPDQASGSATAAAASFGRASSPGVADPAWHTAAGGRVQCKLAGIKTELGYLYRGAGEEHQPSISIQGNLFIDWYLGASLHLPDPPDEAMFVSGGFLYTGNHRRFGGWSFRGEALWNRSDETLGLFPEITWSPSRLFSLFLRSNARPIGTASMHIIGFSWLPATGLTLSLYASIATGRDLSDDNTSNTAEPVGTITVGVRYTF